MFLKPPGAKKAETPDEIIEVFRETLIEYIVETCGVSETEAERRVMTDSVMDAIKDGVTCYIGLWSERIVIATSIPAEMVEGFGPAEPEKPAEKRMLS